jgi:hypothetical protein
MSAIEMFRPDKMTDFIRCGIEAAHHRFNKQITDNGDEGITPTTAIISDGALAKVLKGVKNPCATLAPKPNSTPTSPSSNPTCAKPPIE